MPFLKVTGRDINLSHIVSIDDWRLDPSHCCMVIVSDGNHVRIKRSRATVMDMIRQLERGTIIQNQSFEIDT